MPLQCVDVRSHWDKIKPGLLEIVEQCQTDWRIEDVYASLINKQSFLYVDPSRTETGFIVVRSIQCPFSLQSKLLVWVAHDPINGSVDAHHDEIEDIAKATGHTALEVITPIKGLGRMIESRGYKRIHATYRKQLNEESK